MLQTNIAGLCGEHSQYSDHTGFAPAHSACFPVYTAQAPELLQIALQGAGPELRALPRPEPLRFRFSGTPQRRRLSWACVLCLPRQSSAGSQELDERTLSGCGTPYPLCGPSLSFQARWLGVPCVSSGELIPGCNPPGRCQPSRISESLWLETGNLLAVW